MALTAASDSMTTPSVCSGASPRSNIVTRPASSCPSSAAAVPCAVSHDTVTDADSSARTVTRTASLSRTEGMTASDDDCETGVM